MLNDYYGAHFKSKCFHYNLRWEFMAQYIQIWFKYNFLLEIINKFFQISRIQFLKPKTSKLSHFSWFKSSQLWITNVLLIQVKLELHASVAKPKHVRMRNNLNFYLISFLFYSCFCCVVDEDVFLWKEKKSCKLFFNFAICLLIGPSHSGGGSGLL